jgi:hypothetical protein
MYRDEYRIERTLGRTDRVIQVRDHIKHEHQVFRYEIIAWKKGASIIELSVVRRRETKLSEDQGWWLSK